MTVLFSDLASFGTLSERLDPELLSSLLGRYFAAMSGAVERHGGSLEKFIGDAIMAVFGIPLTREDDALRAVRAALDMRQALEPLNEELERETSIRLTVRIGINTGVVFAGDSARGQSFAIGDAVTVAQRLEAAAPPGGILLGEETHRLVRSSVLAEPIDPLLVKSKSERVRAFRLVELVERDGPRTPSLRSKLVGRERERGLLQDAFQRVVADRSCHLFTVLGPPGIGKSRLVREFVEGLSEPATVLHGRCLPYGDGITYWPVVEAVRQALDLGRGGGTNELLATLAAQLEGEEDAAFVIERTAHLFGRGEVGASSEEMAWALRKLLEARARRQPVVYVIDDLQFAEPTFLDLVEHIADRSRGAPILLICLARLDLLDIRPAWGGRKANTTTVLLESLAGPEPEELVGALLEGSRLPPRIARALAAAAGGNPLFIEEIVATLTSEGLLQSREGVWVATGDLSSIPVPATVQALLAARLERLPRPELDTIERAAIEGEVFHKGAVAHLSPGVPPSELESRLTTLVRKELIWPHPATLPGESAFRFRHLLIRDVAYAALPKQLRAELHQGMAQWLETKEGSPDEIVGYHLERAYRYLAELRLRMDPKLAIRARERLGEAARRALGRGDARAGSRLLERAASLFPLDEAGRLVLLPKLGAALFQAGRLAEAERVLADAIGRAEAEGNAGVASHARVERQLVRLMVESSRGIDDARRIADAALEVLEEQGDDFGCCRAWCLRAWIEWTQCSAATADEAWRRAAVYARRTGQDQEMFQILCWRASSALFGPTPVAQAIRRCDDIRRRVRSSPAAIAVTSHQLAALHAMKGAFESARALVRQGNEILADLGRLNSAVSHPEAWVELLAGHPEAAEERLRLGYGRLEEMGEKAFLATTAAMLAQAVYAQDRHEEAEQFCQVSDTTAAAEDVLTQIMWRGVRAKIRARQNLMDEADLLAREGLRLAEQTDWLNHQGDAFLDLAEVLRLRGRSIEADEAAREGIARYDLKGNVVSARMARSWMRAALV